MCPLNWAVNEKELYFSDPLLVSHCCPVDIGGKGGQDQYEWWCHVTDPMAVVINTIIDHHDHDQDQHHDQINVGQSKVVTKVRRPTVRSLIPSELPLVTKSEVNAR